MFINLQYNLYGVFIYNNSIHSNFIALFDYHTIIAGYLNDIESYFTTENSIYHKNSSKQSILAQTES